MEEERTMRRKRKRRAADLSPRANGSFSKRKKLKPADF